MLEFNKILDFYETLEEAINDFDICMGLDITRSIERKPIQIKKDDVAITTPTLKSTQRASVGGKEKKTKKWSAAARAKVNEAILPVIEKIKLIIIENPNRSFWEIKRELNTQRFGFEKVGLLKLRNLLIKHNLDSREKRFRFYRSR